jgi:hypothetical protein
VPIWHQKLFLSPNEREKKFYYLDLKPDQFRAGNGKTYTKKDVQRWGPESCFYEENLYTLNFGPLATDVIEKQFFGTIDKLGSEALPLVAEFDFRKHGMDCIRHFAVYMDAQKLRTPKALDLLKTSVADLTHQSALYRMEWLSQMHVTMWYEAIWEVFACDHSATKFILSDHPVTAYNRAAFPGGQFCRYPNDPGIELVGTQTIFPLTLTRCLVLTNLEYIRNPKAPPLRRRVNPRFFGNTIMFAGNVHTGRQLQESQVRALNYVVKMRARRFVAAGEREWLYPEEHLKHKSWNELGGKFFLRPDPRRIHFTNGTFVEWNDRTSDAWDEYGQPPDDENPAVKSRRAMEWRTLEESKREWDKQFGPLRHNPDWLH